MTGEHLSEDLQALLALLARHRVRYLVVGGEAVIHHGYARLTGDIDLFYDQNPTNARRLFAALQEFWGGPVPAIDSDEDLLAPGVVIQFGRPPNRLDLISDLGSVEFTSAWRRRVDETLRTAAGARVPVRFIGLADLLQSKRDAGRHKDLDDVEHLEAIHGRSRKRRRR